MDPTQRDNHLIQYFPKETLEQLDEAVKNVLYDDFANSELRVLGTQDVQTITARAARNVNAEYERRLTFIQPEEYPALKGWYQEIAKSVHEIICSKCGALLGLEVDTKDDNSNVHHLEGKFVVACGPLWAYRPRVDGVMGYQCGNVLINPHYKTEVKAYEDAVVKAHSDHEEALKKHEKLVEKWSKANNKAVKEGKEFTEPFPETPQLQLPETPEIVKTYICNNDTRWAQIEIDNIPEDHVMTSITESDIVKVKQEMNITGYEPDVKKTKQGYKVESFELREVK